jgi:hypothetical protein
VVTAELDPETQVTLDKLADSMTDLKEAIQDLHTQQPAALSKAFVDGITTILQNDELMDQLLLRLLRSFGKYATKTTGKWTLDQLRAIPGKVIVWGLVLAIIWQVGGIGAVLKFLTALTKTSP